MKLMILNFNGVFDSLIRELKLLDWEMTDNIDEADVLLAWNDVVPSFVNLIESVQARGKKVIVMQHGIEGFDHYFKKNHKPIADYHWAWDEFDAWCAKKTGAKNVEIMGCPLWEADLIPHPGVPKDYFLYIPRHASWEEESYDHELEDAKIRAKYHDLPLVIKLRDKYDYGAHYSVTTKPYEPSHLGITLWLIKNAKEVYCLGKQTAKVLAETRHKTHSKTEVAIKMKKKLEEICSNIS